MARWHRAAAALDVPDGSRVLDLGCAFGFGTRLLTDRFQTFGHDLSGEYIRRARRSVANATFTQGPAHAVPYPDGFFHGVLLLDVLEHTPNDAEVLREVRRVLRPGGVLVLSVPNCGALERLDSLNVYRVVLGRAHPPTDDPSWTASPTHRHYSVDDLAALLGAQFSLLDACYTGVGLAEAVNIPLLLALRPFRGLRRLYDVAQYLYFAAYLVEDMVPAGDWGYHLMSVWRAAE